ncbi:MAG: hypothetical protein U5J63_07635 [Fodinibius sp.]|nr:hypothetical protein [Fodinibius sp.]
MALLNKLEKKFGIYSSLVNQLQQLSTQSYEDGKEFFTVTIEPYFRTNLLPLIENVRKEIQSSHEQKVASLNEDLAWITKLLGIATILAPGDSDIILHYFYIARLLILLTRLAEAAKEYCSG